MESVDVCVGPRAARAVKKGCRPDEEKIPDEGLPQALLAGNLFGPETAAVDVQVRQDPVAQHGDKKGKIPKGTQFKDLPDDWKCPCCGASKAQFKPLAGPGSVAEQSVKCSA